MTGRSSTASDDGVAAVVSRFDTDSLPPLQESVMEVLAARCRLGEQVWPFSRKPAFKHALDALTAHGLVGYKGGIVWGTYNAWLTDYGKASVLSDTYVLPVDREIAPAQAPDAVSMTKTASEPTP